MSEPKRLRIDVSNEAHAQLETEARRQGITVRDLIEQIVRDMTERRGQADAAVRHQRGTHPTLSDEPEPGSPEDSARRIDALIKRVTDDVPKAIETVRQSSGTGHLRDMLGKQDAGQTERLAAMQTAHLTAQDAQTLLLENGNRELAGKIDALRNEVVVLRAWHKGRRWAFAGGVLSTLGGFMALAFVLAGTAPTRWRSGWWARRRPLAPRTHSPATTGQRVSSWRRPRRCSTTRNSAQTTRVARRIRGR